MAAIKLPLDSADYGFAEFTFGDVKSKPVDLQASHDHYWHLVGKHKDDTDGGDALWAEWRAHLEPLGFPAGLSVAALVQVIKAIISALEELQKKDLPPASSGGPG
jgi:hypothetical protein